MTFINSGSYSQPINENTDLNSVIDYSDNAASTNNVKKQISSINQRLIAYLKEVDTTVENERSYALNSKYFSVEGVDINEKSATKIHDDVVELQAEWKSFKKKLKKKVMAKRASDFATIAAACSRKISRAGQEDVVITGGKTLVGDDKKWYQKQKEAERLSAEAKKQS